MNHSIEVDGVVYRSKSEVGKKAYEILNKYPIGVELSATDKRFVLALLYLRSAETILAKVGTGITSISPMYPNGFQNCRTFKLHRSDGTWTDFSYRKALEKTNNARYAKRAARYEVWEQTEDFKRRNFTGVCSLTGEAITIESCHVDHIPPETFDVLFAAFLDGEGLNIKSVEATNVGDCQIGTVFVDRSLADRWRQYHAKYARLRVISAKANLTLVEKIRGNYCGDAA